LWSDVVKDQAKFKDRLANLKDRKPNLNSWLDLEKDTGDRRGIFKIEPFGESHFHVKVAYEREIKEDYSSIEKILEEEDCLPEKTTVPSPVPTASKASLFLDIKEGICYIYTDTMAPPIETIADIIISLGDDCGMPCKALKVFEWKEELVTTITDIAIKEGFQPYKVKADLENVKVFAEGDFSDNDDWEKMKNSIDLGKWSTVAYVKERAGRHFVFGMTKSRKKMISMPELGDLPKEELFNSILEMRRLIEKALGCDVRQYCFPENISPITRFFK
jgi:hypothetical protein